MSSSSEVFSDISSYENHLQPPIKVNVRKKDTTQSLGLQNVRKESGIVSIANDNKSLGLKRQSNTTSKINHALEVLKKFDNKYKIKTSGLSNITKVIDGSNSSTNVSVKSKVTKIQDVESASHEPEKAVNRVPYVSNHSIGSISQDKISNNIREPNDLPEVVTVDESEEYESDFESSDSESLSVESDDAKDVDSSIESQPSARPRSALSKPNLHFSETESSIHTIAEQESNSTEDVGIFRNIRLFTFSDLGPEGVKGIDELIVPMQLKDSLTKSKSGSGLVEKSSGESKNKLQRTLEMPIPSNIVEKVNTSLDKSSDYESIAESLTNSSESDDSFVPFRTNIFTMDDLDGADCDQSRDPPLIVHQKESDVIREHGANATKTHDVAVATGKLLNLTEDVKKLNDEGSAKQSEAHVLTSDSSTSNASYDSDHFSESDENPKKGSSEESLRLSREIIKRGLVSGAQSSRHAKTQTHSKTMKSAVGIDTWNENLPTQQTRKEMLSAKGEGTRVTEVESKPVKLHFATRDVGVQTEFPENGDEFSENVPIEIRRHKVRPPQPVFEALNLSWDFDIEANNEKSAFIFQHQTFTPEIIEALANQNPAQDALDQVLKQQIALTKHFMASQYKMYQTYCMSVKQLTNQYTPVTLEETKEFIRMHKKMRTNGNNQQVL